MLRGPFRDVEQKTCRLHLLNFCHYLLLSKFSIYFNCLNKIAMPKTPYFFYVKYKYEIIYYKCLYVINGVTFLIASINIKGLNIRYRIA